jgi:nitrate/nitrite transporter NarK
VHPTLAWRVSFILPAFLCFSTAACMWFLADDAPPPASTSAHDNAVFIDVEEARVTEISNPVVAAVGPFNIVTDILADPAVWVLMLVHGMCFGVELAVNNQIGLYLYDYFLRDNCDPSSPLVTDGRRMV